VFTILGLLREGVSLTEPKEGKREKGGETVTRGLKEKKDRGRREKVKTIPVSLDYMGAGECRHMEASVGR